MTVSKSPKPDQQIISNLQSKKTELVLETIEQLRSSGNLSYMPALFDLLNSSSEKEINSAILKLCSDIKNTEIIPLLIDAILDEKYAGIRKNLISICWENRLDFSSYLPLFVELVINEELEVAFEAYTVIINLEGKVAPEMINREIDKMEAALNQVSEQKKQLLIDIIDFLPHVSD